ncbi:uncharacterized protein LOC128647638 [Bombina bombina]|uniref:uncharacterized protein LOC128647638 n=1 Tax=Bombina bombina TaxID=8345 RepID=UPI00235AB120|nr:uncharacterized protein LOC128647638 [Bombina bombina]
MLIFIWVTFSVTGCWSIKGPDAITIPYGASLSVSCSYDKYYTSYIKYFCKGGTRNSCKTLISSDRSNWGINDRLSLEDNFTQFSVTMQNMEPQDSGTYQCGIEFVGLDKMHPIRVTVLPGVCIKSLPWLDMVNFPPNFQQLQENHKVQVSCQKQFENKTFSLECKKQSGTFQFHTQTGDPACIAAPMSENNTTELPPGSSILVSVTFGLLAPAGIKLTTILVLLTVKTVSCKLNKNASAQAADGTTQKPTEKKSVNLYYAKLVDTTFTQQYEIPEIIYENVKLN